MAFKQKIISGTSAIAYQFFTTPQMVAWASVFPHTSNTGSIFIGDSTSQDAIIRTGDAGIDVASVDFVDLSNAYVRFPSVSNLAVILYVERT